MAKVNKLGFGKVARKTVFKIEGRFPRTGAFIIAFMRKIRAFLYRIYFYFSRFKKTIIDRRKIIHFTPVDVKYRLNGGYKQKDIGKIEGGDWDQDVSFVRESDVYKGLYEHFAKNKEWKDTDFYKMYKERFENGEVLWGCMSVEDFDNYLPRIDRLYEDIKKNGYREPGDREKASIHEGRQDPSLEYIDEISFHIDRSGRLLFVNGIHRFAIADILGLRDVPGIIVKRHKKWMEFRGEMIAFTESTSGKELYQEPFHSDLKDIPSTYSLERWPAMKKSLKTKEGKVLDIGANLGLFSYQFESECGLSSTALEINAPEIYFTKHMRDALGTHFEVRNKSFFDMPDDELKTYDVVLALSIFHHFLKREVEYDRLVNFLSKLTCKEMFFEAHDSKDKQMIGAYKNYSPDEFAGFVMKETGLDSKEKIFESKEGRSLYHLYR